VKCQINTELTAASREVRLTEDLIEKSKVGSLIGQTSSFSGHLVIGIKPV